MGVGGEGGGELFAAGGGQSLTGHGISHSTLMCCVTDDPFGSLT